MSLKPPVSGQDHIQGDAHAVIELVEYGDYQCPHCGAAYPIIKAIQRKMGNKLKFVFRNFPLAESHPDAMHAAIASEAASAQGKFWEMHDMLFEHQHNLTDGALLRYAQQLGLDADQFKTEFEKPATTQRVDAGLESGLRSGVNGTPSFFINGKKYNDSWVEETLLENLLELVR
jgi:protein-disulfide isomerase